MRLMMGDKVVVKLPAPATAPKTVALPGEEVTYLGVLNHSTAEVLVRTPGRQPRVVRMHPSGIAPVRRGVIRTWAEGTCPVQQSLEGDAPPIESTDDEWVDELGGAELEWLGTLEADDWGEDD